MKLTNERLTELYGTFLGTDPRLFSQITREVPRVPSMNQKEFLSIINEILEKRREPSSRGAFTVLMEGLKGALTEAGVDDVWVNFSVKLSEFVPFDKVQDGGAEAWMAWLEELGNEECHLVDTRGRSGEEALRRLPAAVRKLGKETL